ncbi:hypothetical protein B0H12DRAFT_131838 [Mycena haematopus]|nr:hypothetical protein B0H12DRAFT_131838 [Mycena haematopus]
MRTTPHVVYRLHVPTPATFLKSHRTLQDGRTSMGECPAPSTPWSVSPSVSKQREAPFLRNGTSAQTLQVLRQHRRLSYQSYLRISIKLQTSEPSCVFRAAPLYHAFFTPCSTLGADRTRCGLRRRLCPHQAAQSCHDLDLRIAHIVRTGCEPVYAGGADPVQARLRGDTVESREVDGGYGCVVGSPCLQAPCPSSSCC